MATFNRRCYKKSRNLKADQVEKSQTAEVFDSLDSTANKSEQWIIKNQTKIFSAIALIAISVLSFLGYQRFISEPKEIEAISELNQAQYFFEQALISSESDSLFKLALNGGIRQFNVESIPEIIMINKIASSLGKKAPISIRVNPDVDAQTHKKIMTGTSENKFGIPLNSALEVYKMASELNSIEIVGIDLHIGSQITDILPFETAFIKIASFIEKLREEGHSIDRVDIGGGLGISYSTKEEDPISIDKFSIMLSKIFSKLNIEIQLEPGRFISGNSGLLITSVVFLKEGTNKNFLIIDAAMNDLLRPAIYDAEHEFLPVSVSKNNDNKMVADIVGPICERSDVFSKNTILPKMTSGDFLSIYSAGAYGAVMSSEYNSRPLIPELIVNENLVSVIRSRPKIEEVIKRDQIPYWLRWLKDYLFHQLSLNDLT